MLQPGYYFFILFYVAAVTLTPYAVLFDGENNSGKSIQFTLLALTQLILALYIFYQRKHLTRQSLSLFWQFISFAIFTSSLNTLSYLTINSAQPYLIADFISLLTYFFVLLAIETNPHLSGIPLNKHINGRLPAMFFVVTCFCFFVLLPYEFNHENYQSGIPSAYFHTVICSLVLIRLVAHLIKCQDRLWQQFYGYLTLASFILFVNHLNTFMTYYNQSPLADYVVSLLNFMPLLLLLVAFKQAGRLMEPLSKNKQVQQVETYIYSLSLALIVLYLLGTELSLPYTVAGIYQPLSLVLWCTFSLGFMTFVSHQKSVKHTRLKRDNQQLLENISQLNQQNTNLHLALVNSEEKAIVASSNNPILTVSTQGKVLSVNPAAVHLFQLLEQSFVGSNIAELFDEDENMHHFFKYESNLYQLQRQSKGMSLESIARRSDGEHFPVQVALQWTERNDLPIVVVTFVNLTERKLAEKQALDLKDKFIANISHEFRTPLTIINGILERYLKLTKDNAQIAELNTAKRNGLRLVRMVEQLLELSRLTNNPTLTISTYRLSSLMNMPLDSFKKLAAQHQLTFSHEIPENFWINCDPQAFEKVIFNLLANAVKYTPQGGTIEVNAYKENDTIYLAVNDTGIGIKKSSKEAIFERFQRADDDKNKAVFGVGIGLSLVNEIVNAHHWRLSLISEYNKGSKFTLAIPQAEPCLAEADVTGLISADEVSSLLDNTSTQQNLTISKTQRVVLVIEDNHDMQSHIKQVIGDHHHCLLSTSGEQGLVLAKEYLPDLIVCDIMLTGIDGFEVLQQLKQEELTSHIPVILLTARSDLDSRLKGLNLQADDYLSKPFNQQELLTRIDNLMTNRDRLRENYQQQFVQTEQVQQFKKNEKQALETVNDKFLAKLDCTLEKLYIEPELDIKILANKLAVSERQLQRKLKVLVGLSPNHYIREFRLEKAKELLASGAPIGLIALDVGFSSQTYFGRCFKEKYQCTPKQYQAQCLVTNN